jgi:hypothetical protein
MFPELVHIEPRVGDVEAGAYLWLVNDAICRRLSTGPFCEMRVDLILEWRLSSECHMNRMRRWPYSSGCSTGC